MQLTYKNGKAEIKEGKKVIASIINRKEFFKGTKLENSFTQFPFSLTMGSGMAECKSEEDALNLFYAKIA